jgi:hypothetical protein
MKAMVSENSQVAGHEMGTVCIKADALERRYLCNETKRIPKTLDLLEMPCQFHRHAIGLHVPDSILDASSGSTLCVMNIPNNNFPIRTS